MGARVCGRQIESAPRTTTWMEKVKRTGVVYLWALP